MSIWDNQFRDHEIHNVFAQIPDKLNDVEREPETPKTQEKAMPPHYAALFKLEFDQWTVQLQLDDLDPPDI
jgi:hypothetical protein